MSDFRTRERAKSQAWGVAEARSFATTFIDHDSVVGDSEGRRDGVGSSLSRNISKCPTIFGWKVLRRLGSDGQDGLAPAGDRGILAVW